MNLAATDELAKRVVAVIRAGDLDALEGLLQVNPGLAEVRIVDESSCARTLLHVVTDWPGYFPNGPEVVRRLIAAGADPKAPFEGGPHEETPLHWAASSDDLEVAVALIEGGASIEARGAVIAGGTPLDDAVAFGCWNVAHMLVARGARVDDLWKAAALGLRDRVEELLTEPVSQAELNHAFWQACHGGQRRMAERLLERGAEINSHPDHSEATPVEIAARGGTQRDQLVEFLKERGAL